MITEQLSILENLIDWFNRKTTPNAVRRAGGVLSLALSTDIGTVRTENQDRCAVLRICNNDGKMLVIAVLCDGMGGMESGADCASKAISNFLYHCVCSINEPIDILLKNAVSKANDAVFSTYEGRGGATLSAFCLDSNGVLTGVNVGDSRIYCLDKQVLTQLSSDDTLAGQFGNRAIEFSNRNELLQHVGIGNDIEPHILSIKIPEDRDIRLLVTSDGVHFLDHDLISSVIKHAPDSARAAQRLTELSKWCGGKDNATTVISPSIDQLIAFRDSSKVGTIEVWDPFGDLLLLSLAPQPPKVIDFQTPIIRVTPDKPKRTRKKRQIKSLKTKATGKKTIKKKSAAKTKSKDKPQLDIKFDTSQGE